MERRIRLSDIQRALQQAYEKALTIKDGSVDPRLDNVNPEQFGVSVAFTDGYGIDVGDTNVKSPLGGIAKIPALLTLMQQLDDPMEAVERGGTGCCYLTGRRKHPQTSVSAYGTRLVSALEPNGDSTGKWDALTDGINQAMGSMPELNEDLYRRLTKINIDTNAEDVLADLNFYLYDNAAMSIDLYTRLTALEATTTQMAAYGATIAADGVNPRSRAEVFNHSFARRIAASMAVSGPHLASQIWLVNTGLPARSSFGGLIMGVLPGVFSIAAYSPYVSRIGISIRSAAAINYFMNSLQLSALSSSKVIVEK